MQREKPDKLYLDIHAQHADGSCHCCHSVAMNMHAADTICPSGKSNLACKGHKQTSYTLTYMRSMLMGLVIVAVQYEAP